MPLNIINKEEDRIPLQNPSNGWKRLMTLIIAGTPIVLGVMLWHSGLTEEQKFWLPIAIGATILLIVLCIAFGAKIANSIMK